MKYLSPLSPSSRWYEPDPEPVEPDPEPCACGCGEDADPATGYAPACGLEVPEEPFCSCGKLCPGFVEVELHVVSLAAVPARVAA